MWDGSLDPLALVLERSGNSDTNLNTKLGQSWPYGGIPADGIYRGPKWKKRNEIIMHWNSHISVLIKLMWSRVEKRLIKTFHVSVWQVASLPLSNDRGYVSLSSREAEKVQAPKSGSHMAKLIQEMMIKNNDHIKVKHHHSCEVQTLKRLNEAYLLAPSFYNHFTTFHWV